MYNQYNLEATSINQTISSFKKFLSSEKISSGSIRSYLSDTRHFLGWLVFFLQNHGFPQIREKLVLSLSKDQLGISENQFINLLKQVNQKVLEEYKIYQVSNNIPTKTINRRFSSLRKFGAFCKSQNWLSENYFDTLKTIVIDKPFPESEWHLGEFRSNLWKNNASKSTIKNYLADIKQFLSWSERKNNLKF